LALQAQALLLDAALNPVRVTFEPTFRLTAHRDNLVDVLDIARDDGWHN
jgi:hypothetical protein